MGGTEEEVRSQCHHKRSRRGMKRRRGASQCPQSASERKESTRGSGRLLQVHQVLGAHQHPIDLRIIPEGGEEPDDSLGALETGNIENKRGAARMGERYQKTSVSIASPRGITFSSYERLNCKQEAARCRECAP